MVNFWVFFQIQFIVLTDEHDLNKVLDDIKHLFKKHFLSNSYYEKHEIIDRIKELNPQNIKKFSKQIFDFYNALEGKTKNEIEIFSKKHKEYNQIYTKLKEKMSGLTNQNKISNKKIREFIKQENNIHVLFRTFVDKTVHFVNLLEKIEKTFVARQHFRQLNKEDKSEYLQRVETLERKAAEKLKCIDETWKGVINVNLNYETDYYMKYRILIQTTDCWRKFKKDLNLKNNKDHSLVSFNYCFYTENFDFLLYSLGIHLDLKDPYRLLIKHFRQTPVEEEKGDIFQQLEALNTVKYFKVDRSIEQEEELFFFVINFSFSLLNEDYTYIISWYFELLKTIYKMFVTSLNPNETKELFSLIDTVAEQEQFLTKLRNRPDFLVVALERTRQLLDKVKETVSLRLGSVFVEEHELVSSFREGELANHPYLFSCKMFSLGKKLTDLFADVEELSSLEISNDAIKSAILRYEYYLTFPFLLFADKESLVTPEKGVNQYCRRVFAQNDKEGCVLEFCSEETETFPLITWLGSDLLLENEKSKTKEIKNSLRKFIPKHMIVFLLVVFVIGLSLFVTFYKSLFFRFYYRRRVASKKNRKSTE